MPSLDVRLVRLEQRRPRRPAPAASSFDPTRLTMREQWELDRLLAPLAPLPGERWELGPLTDAQLDRSAALMDKAHGIPPSPAYRDMPHRDPGIGPCRCRDCDAKPTPPDDDDGRPDAAA